MVSLKDRLHNLSERLLAADLSDFGAPARWALGTLRALLLAGKRFRRDRCIEQAAALSFISLLSLIPIGFLFLFFLRAFHLGGYWEQLKEFLVQNLPKESRNSVLAWLGEMEKDRISTVQNLPYYVMVIAGLILSALWLFESSEKALNRIWRSSRSRSYVQRLTVFWLIVTASPFLLALSAFLRSSLESNPAIQPLMSKTVILETFYAFFVPAAVATFAFFFVYLLVPAARVQIVPALAGGLFAAICWEAAKSLLSYIIPRAVTFSVYGSLGAIAAFLFWFYLSWSVLLYGAQLSYVVQYPRQATLSLAAAAKPPRLPPGLLALAAALEIAEAADKRMPPPSLSDLSEKWALPADLIRRELLETGNNVFHRAHGEEEVYYLSRDTDRIRVTELLSWPVPGNEALFASEPLRMLVEALRTHFGEAIEGLTIRDLLNRNISLRPLVRT